MYLKPKLDATAPKAAPKGRRENKQTNKKKKARKKNSAFGKTFTISARGKTRAKRQREHAMGEPQEMMRATRLPDEVHGTEQQQQQHHTPHHPAPQRTNWHRRRA